MITNINKIKIEPVTLEEGMAYISKGIDALGEATIEQLKASLVGLAETFVQMMTEGDESTQAALVMEVVFNTLEENKGMEFRRVVEIEN